MTGTTGADDYQFDANGRLMFIDRDGTTLDLNHDAQDRLTSVENETTGSTISYTYDAQGRRVAATEGAEVRQFLVAPAMGGGLESTDLIADGNGNLISNYVYAGGASPFMMLDAQGNPVYYLSDGMGSVIGLANSSGNEVGDFRYDSFGNVREEWGWAIGSAGGDFRFQGQWLEANTGIYHFRARDYDAQTGTFLSRDPINPNEQQPEAMNPYQFAYGNPFVYSDPSGLITLMELTVSDKLGQIIENNAKTQAYQYLKDKAGEVVGNALWSAFRSILPGGTEYGETQNILELARGSLDDRFEAGTSFENLLRGQICNFLAPIEGVTQNLWLTPTLDVSTGRVLSPGFHCPVTPPDNRIPTPGRYSARPDFLVSPERPDRSGVRSWLVGDVKLSLRRLAADYTENDERGRRQFEGIANHANNHGSRVAGFIALKHGNSQNAQQWRAALTREAVEKQIIALVLTLFDG